MWSTSYIEQAHAAQAWAAAVLQGVVPPAAVHAHQLLLQQRQSAAADMQVRPPCVLTIPQKDSFR